MEPKKRRKNAEPEPGSQSETAGPGCSSWPSFSSGSKRHREVNNDVQVDVDTVSIKHGDHHVQRNLCYSRAKYRQGKEFKAVKVYTINDESKHLILQDIPDVGLKDELLKLCQRFGSVEEFRRVDPEGYPPCNPFTAVYYVKYATLHLARYAKTKLDNRAFYGGLIHICYAPEMETIDETREKLEGRRRYVQMYPIKQARLKK